MAYKTITWADGTQTKESRWQNAEGEWVVRKDIKKVGDTEFTLGQEIIEKYIGIIDQPE
jgi:hypothetical protein